MANVSRQTIDVDIAFAGNSYFSVFKVLISVTN
jgi:hypothetical protein